MSRPAVGVDGVGQQKRRRIIEIVPYEQAHYALLKVRPEQRGELALLGQTAGAAAKLGPAFSAVERDDKGHIAIVLACGGLAENVPESDPGGGYATAWAAFGADLRPAQWSAVTGAIRSAIARSAYARIDMAVRTDFAAARRYAEALGFTPDVMLYARPGGAAKQQAAEA